MRRGPLEPASEHPLWRTRLLRASRCLTESLFLASRRARSRSLHTLHDSSSCASNHVGLFEGIDLDGHRRGVRIIDQCIVITSVWSAPRYADRALAGFPNLVDGVASRLDVIGAVPPEPSLAPRESPEFRPVSPIQGSNPYYAPRRLAQGSLRRLSGCYHRL